MKMANYRNMLGTVVIDVLLLLTILQQYTDGANIKNLCKIWYLVLPVAISCLFVELTYFHQYIGWYDSDCYHQYSGRNKT
jgi:hypothetical protein